MHVGHLKLSFLASLKYSLNLSLLPTAPPTLREGETGGTVSGLGSFPSVVNHGQQ